MDDAAYHAARDRVLWHVVGGASDERYAPGVAWWWDNHRRVPASWVVFQVVLAGCCVLRTRDGDVDVRAGHAFLFAYDEPTAYGRPPDRGDHPSWRQPLRTAHLILSGAGLREHWDVMRMRFGPVFALDQRARCLALLGELRRGLSAAADRRPGSPAAHAFVMSVFDAIEAAAAEGRAPVARAIDELLRAPLASVSLKAVARRHGCTREHLTRVFTARIGEPPARWLRRARVQRALDLLRTSDLPLSAVAAQAGFGSVRTLARQVRAATRRVVGDIRGGRPRSR